MGERGWTVVPVDGPILCWAYSVGLAETLGCPDLICFGETGEDAAHNLIEVHGYLRSVDLKLDDGLRWEGLGIVDMRKGSGVYLRVAVNRNLVHVPLLLARPSKVTNLVQALKVRRALEGEAAALCAMSATDEAISDIEAALLRMEAVHASGNASEDDPTPPPVGRAIRQR